MFILNENSSNNQVVLSLNGKITQNISTDPIFLFELIKDDDKVQTYTFICDDISINKFRYNQFNVVCTGETEENRLIGHIHLETPGFYQYNVYVQESNSNLNPTLSLGLIDSGKCFYNSSISEQTRLPQFEYTGQTSLYIYNN
jgi:hypothetical protein